MKTDEQKEIYIDQACSEALGQQTLGEKDRIQRISFWQGLSTNERMAATWEITKRVHIASGGKMEDFKLNKSVSVLNTSPK